jgi:Mesyanzhinovviridae Dda-like helicase
MEWSPQQSKALDAAGDWLRDPSGPQVFKLWGFAGTGKSTIATHLAAGFSGPIHYAAFTGKAASIMRKMGCPGATTIHSLIYKFMPKGQGRVKEIEAQLDDIRRQISACPAEDADTLSCLQERECEKEKELAEERKGLKQPRFSRKNEEESPLGPSSLLVVDECSMVSDSLADDLLSFGPKVLALGDPAQLPPVRGCGYFSKGQPDALLTEIHRQAADNPIIAMATAVREGRGLPIGKYGDSLVADRRKFDPKNIGADVQIICGRNATRRALNQSRRTASASALVEPGEKVVCLRNNHDLGLMNGTIWYVDSASGAEGLVYATVRPEDDPGAEPVGVAMHEKPFRGEEVDYWEAAEAEQFDYGYVLTCHKAQGSSWPKVAVFDESECFRQDARRWIYTALTRASEKVLVLI